MIGEFWNVKILTCIKPRLYCVNCLFYIVIEMKQHIRVSISLVLIVSLFFYLSNSAAPSTTRSSYYNQKCEGVNLENVLDQTRSNKDNYKKTLNQLYGDYFKIESTFYAKLLAHTWADHVLSKDVTVPADQSPDGFHNVSGVNISYVVYIVSAVISFIIMIIMAVLCCMSFEKLSCLDSNRQFTKCEKYWPRICLGIFIMIIFIWIIVGFADIASFKTVYKNSECMRSRVFDNLFNGAISADQQKTFSGLTSLQSQVSLIPISLLAFSTQIPTYTSGISTANAALTTFRTTVSKIPNDTVGGALFLYYPAPIHVNPNTTTVPSTFIDILGTPTTTNSLIYNVTNPIDSLQADLTSANTALTSISTNLASSTTALSALLTKLQTLISSLNTMMQDLESADTNLMTGLFTASIVFFSLVLAVLVITVPLLLLLICLKLVKLKVVVYGVLGSLVALMIYGFVLCTLFGYFFPALVDVCKYGDSSLMSKSNFRWSYEGIFSSEEMNYLEQCLPYDQSNIIDQFLGTQLKTLLNDVSTVSLAASSISASGYSTKVSSGYAAIGTGLTDLLTLKYIDLNDTTSLTKLNSLSKSSNYACTAPGFSSDSFVPSNTQTQIPCNIPSGSLSSAGTCPISFTTRTTAGCNGCMDSNSYATLLFSSQTQSAIQTVLLTRYPSPLDCTIFASELSNVWVNYYIYKLTPINSVKTRYTTGAFFAGVANTAITAVQTTFAGASSTLSGFDSSINSQTGLLATVDCRVIGQTTQEYFVYTCMNYLHNIRLLLAALAFVSFCLPFTYCGIILILIRQMKGSQQLNEGNKIVNEKTVLENTLGQGSQKQQNIRDSFQKQYPTVQYFEGSNIEQDQK